MLALIFIGDLLYCPYIRKYEEILQQEKVDYEVLYWNRSGFETENNRYIGYQMPSKLKKSKISKLFDFLKYRNWLVKRIQNKSYDRLILLSSLTGVMLLPQLLSKYKNNYIFDIRDYSYEKNVLFYYAEKIVIDNSRFTTLSSKGFNSFLPKSSKYIYTHNMDLNDMKQTYSMRKNNSGRLRFVWMGSVRYLEHQKHIIDKLDADGRFDIIFHGIGPELDMFKKCAEEHGWKNVVFTGKYSEEDKTELLMDADILNNSYLIKMGTKYAVSNKFYDGLIFKVPQLVEKDSYKENIIGKTNIGIALHIQDVDFAEKLFQYYQNIDVSAFNEECDSLLQQYKTEEENCIEKIRKYVK